MFRRESARRNVRGGVGDSDEKTTVGAGPMMLASSILYIAMAASAQGGPKWEVVVSKEGKFTVEMPRKPNHSGSSQSKGPNGKVTIHEISCETPGGVFLIVRIEDPLVIPKNIEEKYLVFTRDMYASKFQGRVTSDKKVTLEGSGGRDFTIEAKGGVTIRAREYLRGTAVYLMLVASQPNAELPAEAGRFLGSFAFGLHPEGTTARTDPKETEAVGKAIKGWGMAIDPDGDVAFKPAARVLTVEVPGKLHDLAADIGKFNAPRVMQEVDGDFTMVLQVDGSFTFSPGVKSTKAKTVPLQGAGLLLWKDAGNYIFLQRTAMFKGGKVSGLVLFEEREAGHRGATHNLVVPTGALMLRLERKGSRLIGAVSNDGSNWQGLKPIDTTWADGPVRVGLVAVNTSSDVSQVKFSNYQLKGGR